MKKLFFILFSIGLLQNASSQVLNQRTHLTYDKIQEAIDIAMPGDSLYLQDEIYKEFEINIKKPLYIHGSHKAIIDGDFKGTVLKIASNNVHLDGFKIINIGQSYTKDYAAILLNRSEQFIIENLIIEKAFFGVLVEKSKNGLIQNNEISGNSTEEASSGNGIHMWHSSDILVKNNYTHNLRDGIYFEFVTNSNVENNRSVNNIRYGLHFMFSNHDNYKGNTFENNGAGVAVMFSKWIKMTNNLFKKNWGTASYGLLLKEIYDLEAIGNTFEENTIAINIEGSTRILYRKNTFSNNGWAIKVAGACYQNEFIENNFLNNSFDVSYNSKINDNLFENNFWSSYTGYDLDRDGIGDIPYRPVKLFSYVVNKTPETIVLLRSLFIDILNFSEKVSPVFTPEDLIDAHPLTHPIQ